jgi:hypothetical protein
MIRFRCRGARRFGFTVLRWLIEAAEDQRRPKIELIGHNLLQTHV